MFSQCRSIDDRSEKVEEILADGLQLDNFTDLMRLATPGVVRSIIGIKAQTSRELTKFKSNLVSRKVRFNPNLVTYI